MVPKKNVVVSTFRQPVWMSSLVDVKSRGGYRIFQREVNCKRGGGGGGSYSLSDQYNM